MTDEADDMAPDDALAAEYVLGVQTLEERRAVARRIEEDRAFADLVDDWVVRLMPLERGAPERPVPAAVERRLQAALFGAGPKRGALGALADSLAFWRLATAALFLLAAGATALAVLRPGPGGGAPERLVATLQASGAPAPLVASYDRATGSLSLEGDLTALADPAGRDAELWVIPGDQTPRSLGVVAASGARTITPSRELAMYLGSGAVLAISLEPPGGSPTGAPTGPVVASGAIQAL